MRRQPIFNQIQNDFYFGTQCRQYQENGFYDKFLAVFFNFCYFHVFLLFRRSQNTVEWVSWPLSQVRTHRPILFSTWVVIFRGIFHIYPHSTTYWSASPKVSRCIRKNTRSDPDISSPTDTLIRGQLSQTLPFNFCDSVPRPEMYL